MVSLIYCCAIEGIEASIIEVEVYISPGMPSFSIVGLADTAVKESRDRVFAALKNSGYDFPTRKITVNLAPADTKKEGGAFDLPIALAILACTGIIKEESLTNFCAIGELSLNGQIRRVKGVLPIALSINKAGKNLIVPYANRQEAAIVKGVNVYPFRTLKNAVDFLSGSVTCEPYIYKPTDDAQVESVVDFEDVKGQFGARRAAEISAAGGHNILMSGPPGSGKTMIAKRLPGILPPMSFDESIETTKIWSVAGKLLFGGLVKLRPFRSPHHTSSSVAMAGGGQVPRSGEVSLAHNGILFLDEFAEFRRDTLEILRQPLEDKCITISRAKNNFTFPAAFMLVAAMNPCPCGNLGNPFKECTCTPYQVQKYRSKISGPLIDRIDIQINVPPLKISEMADEQAKPESSYSIKQRVVAARDVQILRFKGLKVYSNSQMSVREIKKFCLMDEDAKKTLRLAVEKMKLSSRAYDRVLKVSRTVADLDKSELIKSVHVAEALQYRLSDIS